MQITYNVALEVASHEAIVRQAYKDSVGKWTFSVGLTNATGHNVERYIGNPQPLEHCLAIYVWALEKYADRVREAFAGHNLTETQFAAALSFEWNTGSIKRASWVKEWKAGNIAGARRSIMNWKSPPEIIPRREKERDLFFDGKWSNNGTILEYTRVSATGHPVWSSAKRVNIERELRAAFGPEKPTSAPQPTPAPNPAPGPQPQPAPTQGFWAALATAIAKLFRRT